VTYYPALLVPLGGSVSRDCSSSRKVAAEVLKTLCPRTSENSPCTHLGEWASLPCSKSRGCKKGVEHILPANEPLFVPVSLWGGLVMSLQR
jgi:hypothetical protein